VFIGFSDELPVINTDEVASFKFESLENIGNQMYNNPEQFTVWFRIAFDRVVEYYSKKLQDN
jgi:isopentenyl-diphosphate delta-isomerase